MQPTTLSDFVVATKKQFGGVVHNGRFSSFISVLKWTLRKFDYNWCNHFHYKYQKLPNIISV